MKSTHRIIFLALVIVMALGVTSLAMAGPPFANPNCLLEEQGAPFGEPNHWIMHGPLQYVDEPGESEPDWVVVFPDVDQTQALYQVFNVPAGALPNTYEIEAEFSKRDLTANTAFAGVIIHYNDGSKSRVYKTIAPGGAIDEETFLSPYLSGDVDWVKLGVVYFGKRGDGILVANQICMWYPTDPDD